MGKILDNFLSYLRNTSEEKIASDWAEIKGRKYCGPTIDEFLGWKLILSNKFSKPEYYFGFFLD